MIKNFCADFVRRNELCRQNKRKSTGGKPDLRLWNFMAKCVESIVTKGFFDVENLVDNVHNSL